MFHVHTPTVYIFHVHILHVRCTVQLIFIGRDWYSFYVHIFPSTHSYQVIWVIIILNSVTPPTISYSPRLINFQSTCFCAHWSTTTWLFVATVLLRTFSCVPRSGGVTVKHTRFITVNTASRWLLQPLGWCHGQADSLYYSQHCFQVVVAADCYSFFCE